VHLLSIPSQKSIKVNDLVRDTAAGYFIRYVTRDKFLHYLEERPGFEIAHPRALDKHLYSGISLSKLSAIQYGEAPKINESDANTARPSILDGGDIQRIDHDPAPQQIASQALQSAQIHPGIILVDWYGYRLEIWPFLNSEYPASCGPVSNQARRSSKLGHASVAPTESATPEATKVGWLPKLLVRI
jgi:hypothetical protein